MLAMSSTILALFLKTAPKTLQFYNYRSCAPSSVPKEEKIRLRGWNINYLKVGTGPHHVLCNPGAMGTIWTNFKPQVEGMNRKHFTVVAWDPPGHGESRPPEREFLPDHTEKDADFAVDFMKALKIPRYSVLGWSHGSATSIILAAKYPESVNKLVLWGAKSFILPHELEYRKKLKDMSLYPKKFLKPMVDTYGEELFSKYWGKWTDSVVALYHANNGDICSSWLKDIKCPTFILGGAKDPIADVSHVSYLNKHIVDSRIHIYPEGSHALHYKYAEDFNKRVQEFLRE